MSDPADVVVDLQSWVDAAKNDPTLLLERQATEIFLTALGLSSTFSDRLYLKGGLLMGVVYNSPRLTADLDLTADFEPNLTVETMIRETLDAAFPRAAAKLGYPDIQCRVQTIKRQPRRDFFEEANFPALRLTIGYAKLGSRQSENLKVGQSSNTLRADISFREPIHSVQRIRLNDDGSTILAYSLIDLIAEKFRALLQQQGRNRYRRQDIYDLSFLMEKFHFGNQEREVILSALTETCRSRGIEPGLNSLSEPEVKRRARAEWQTLILEIDELPDFDSRFRIVEQFYQELPWPKQ